MSWVFVVFPCSLTFKTLKGTFGFAFHGILKPAEGVLFCWQHLMDFWKNAIIQHKPKKSQIHLQTDRVNSSRAFTLQIVSY